MASIKVKETAKQLLNLGFVVAFIFTLFLSVYIPARAGFGGQWARPDRGNGIGPVDHNFYPATNLYPNDAILAVLWLVLMFVIVRLLVKKKQYTKIPYVFIFAALTPFLWKLLTHFSGYDYSQCHLSNTHDLCQDPSGITNKWLVMHGVVALIAFIGIMKFAAFIRTKSTKRTVRS